MALGDDFHSAMLFVEFYNLKSMNGPRGGNTNFNNNYELQCTMGKLTIPNFDGLSKSIARAWFQKFQKRDTKYEWKTQ